MNLTVPPLGHRSIIERPVRAAGPQVIGKALGRHVRSRAIARRRESSGESMSKDRVTCLRCSEVELIPATMKSGDTDLFHCPACHRRYARRPGRALTYPWLSPPSLPLYCTLFDENPVSRASEIAEIFIKQETPDDLRRIVVDIEEELDRPTQQVRDILDNPQSEELCREFLRQFAANVRQKLGAA
jgi:hypothetical protein